MTAMTDRDVQSPLCQVIGSTPTSPSSQLTTPKSRLKIWANTRATATIEVTLGSSTPMRNMVRNRSLALRMCARTSARTSCGTAHITINWNVFRTAIQKYSSPMISR